MFIIAECEGNMVNGAYPNSSDYRENAIIMYHCKEGFSRLEKDKDKASCQDSVWDGSVEDCELNYCPPEDSKISFSELQDKKFGNPPSWIPASIPAPEHFYEAATRTVKCEEGFAFDKNHGSAFLTQECHLNSNAIGKGKWSPNGIACIRMTRISIFMRMGESK